MVSAPRLEFEANDLGPTWIPMAGEIRFPTLDPAAMLVWIGATEFDLDQRSSGPDCSFAPCDSAFGNGVNAISDHGEAEPEVGVRDRIADAVSGRAYPFESRISDCLLYSVDAEVDRPDSLGERTGYRRLSSTG